MPVIRIKAYHSSKAVGNGLKYAHDPGKTTLHAEGAETDRATIHSPSEASMQQVFSYAHNTDKTTRQDGNDKEILVTGFQCEPETAEQDFDHCRASYLRSGHRDPVSSARSRRILRAKLDDAGNPVLDEHGNMIYDPRAPVYHDPKTGKAVYETCRTEKQARTAYMWVMSFPSEKALGHPLDPKLVHEIGLEFCREYLSDYACTVSTHMGTHCLHNHILQCAYSLDGTHKYRDNMSSLAKARDISDALSVKFGIPIILSPETEKGISWFEWKKRHDGISWKQHLRTDIRKTISICKTPADFVPYMEQLGYQIRETANHYTFVVPGTDEKGQERRIRDKRLNHNGDRFDYTKAGIAEVIDKRQKHRPQWDLIPRPPYDPVKPLPTDVLADIWQVSGYAMSGRRRTELEKMVIRALKVITVVWDAFQPEVPPNDHPVYERAADRIKRMDQTLLALSKYEISGKNDLTARLNETGMALSMARKQVRVNRPLKAQNERLLHQLNEAELLYGLLPAFGLTVEDLQIPTASPEEVRRNRAKIMPMTPEQRKELYLSLSSSAMYRLRCKYDELDHREAEKIIDFLKGRSTECPPDVIDLSLPREAQAKKPRPEAERSSGREKGSERFQEILSSLPLDRQAGLLRLQRLFTELSGVGIAPEDLEKEQKNVLGFLDTLRKAEDEMKRTSDRYRELKQLEYNLSLAENRKFTHGPLFTEEQEPIQPDNRSVPEEQPDPQESRDRRENDSRPV